MSASTTITGMPALAKHMAMPPPMVPAPITAARRTSRGLRAGEFGQLRRLALGKEDVALGLRLLAGDEFEEQRALARERLLDR